MCWQLSRVTKLRAVAHWLLIRVGTDQLNWVELRAFPKRQRSYRARCSGKAVLTYKNVGEHLSECLWNACLIAVPLARKVTPRNKGCKRSLYELAQDFSSQLHYFRRILDFIIRCRLCLVLSHLVQLAWLQSRSFKRFFSICSPQSDSGRRISSSQWTVSHFTSLSSDKVVFSCCFLCPGKHLSASVLSCICFLANFRE